MNNKMVEDIIEKVFTAIGEVSMCWSPIPKGQFDSTKAKDVGERLVAYVLSRAEQGEDKDEPLACLADRNGYWVNTNSNGSVWRVYLGSKGNLKAEEPQFEEKTYAQAEQAARAYLEGLDDVKGGI